MPSSSIAAACWGIAAAVVMSVAGLAGIVVIFVCKTFELMYKSTSEFAPGVRNCVAKLFPAGIFEVLIAQKPLGNVT